MLARLAVTVGALAAIATVAVLLPSRWRDGVPAIRQKPTVLYIGAEDCGPCRTWQRDDGAAFRSSAEFARISYREVKSPRLMDLLKDEHWPEDLRRYRERLGRGAGAPMWLVVVDDEIVERSLGVSQWRERALPRITALLR
jgi:hypothetical protein